MKLSYLLHAQDEPPGPPRGRPSRSYAAEDPGLSRASPNPSSRAAAMRSSIDISRLPSMTPGYHSAAAATAARNSRPIESLDFIERPPASRRSQTCKECNQTFPLKVRYLHHLVTAHGITHYESKQILLCPRCPSAFLRNTDRSKHNSCVHEKVRPFSCTEPNCTSSFFFQKDLIKHKNTVHLRHKPYVCQLCDKAFGKREHMTSHVKRVHQKLRPFKCTICDIRLASKYNLQGHLKTAAHAAAERLANKGMHSAIVHRRGVSRIGEDEGNE